jgi:hypothetical protein
MQGSSYLVTTMLAPERSPARRRNLIRFAIVTAAVAVVLHALSARLCYRATYSLLTAIDKAAVMRGAHYLRGDPGRAESVARAFALDHGITEGEISFIRTSTDGPSIGMCLRRRLPTYVVALAMGLPSDVVSVTVWARLQDSGGSPESARLFTAGLAPSSIDP